MVSEALKLLKRVGLEQKRDFYPRTLSGGQKQRLAIARAIAREPEIYIFDDSFSALDYKTDSKLRKELKSYTKEASNIIVAQRIGTIINKNTCQAWWYTPAVPVLEGSERRGLEVCQLADIVQRTRSSFSEKPCLKNYTEKQ